MNTTNQEKSIKELFIGNCWQYLSDNFHKFTETNKIKIALELCKKDTPQEMTGTGGETRVIVIRSGDKIGEKDRPALFERVAQEEVVG